MPKKTKEVGRYSFKCAAGTTLDWSKQSWLANPFERRQYESKLFTVSALTRPALVKWLDKARARVTLLEVGLYLFTNDKHLDGRVFDATGTLSFRPSSAAANSALETFNFSFQLLADHVSRGQIAVTLVDVTLPADGRVKDVTVDLVLSEVLSHGKPALELGILQYLHDPEVCDCSFLLSGAATPLYATRVLLMRSPFFKAMFSGDWAETQSKDPIKFTSWDAPAVALAFVYIYSGWTPDVPLPSQTPADLLTDFACVPSTLPFARWRNLLDLAQFLGLKDLALAVNRKLVALLEEQSRELEEMPDVQEDDDPRPRKRKLAQRGASKPPVSAAKPPASTGPTRPTASTFRFVLPSHPSTPESVPAPPPPPAAGGGFSFGSPGGEAPLFSFGSGSPPFGSAGGGFAFGSSSPAPVLAGSLFSFGPRPQLATAAAAVPTAPVNNTGDASAAPSPAAET
ncbi:hypothetical protein GGF32_008586 [Allomyces javanicus]|nr:hypothetical protein GGF32_008586 [Allomyces javanicus]